MSNDYVLREEAKNAAALIALTSAKREMTCGEVKRIMEGIPPADVRPVVRGRWEPHPSNPEYDVCSACGTGTRRREYHHQGHVPGVTEFCYWFCPWCGADMKEVKNDV